MGVLVVSVPLREDIPASVPVRCVWLSVSLRMHVCVRVCECWVLGVGSRWESLTISASFSMPCAKGGPAARGQARGTPESTPGAQTQCSQRRACLGLALPVPLACQSL